MLQYCVDFNQDNNINKLYLPTQIVDFHFGHPYWCSNTPVSIIFEQISNMKYLQKLRLSQLSFDHNKLNTINRKSLTKLILHRCQFKSLSNFVSLKYLVCEGINFDYIDMKSFSNLTKLKVKNSDTFYRNYFCELKNLQILKLIDSGKGTHFDHTGTFTNLSVYINSKNIKINECNNLKRFQTNNSDLFFKLLREGFPSSLKDIYIKLNKETDADLSTLLMKDINLHFVK